MYMKINAYKRQSHFDTKQHTHPNWLDLVPIQRLAVVAVETCCCCLIVPMRAPLVQPKIDWQRTRAGGDSVQWGGLSWNHLSGIHMITSQSTFPYSKWYVWLGSVESGSWALYLTPHVPAHSIVFNTLDIFYGIVRKSQFLRRGSPFGTRASIAAGGTSWAKKIKRIQKPCSELSKMHFSLMRGTFPDGVQPRWKPFLVQRYT